MQVDNCHYHILDMVGYLCHTLLLPPPLFLLQWPRTDGDPSRTFLVPETALCACGKLRCVSSCSLLTD
jgi:hypothetical protein